MSSTKKQLIGQTVGNGRFTIKSFISGGGFGMVYIGYDQRLKREVAIKVLQPADALGPNPTEKARLRHEGHIERFKREASMIATLKSNHTVNTYDYFEEEMDGKTRHFLIMELLDGETLDAYLDPQSDVYQGSFAPQDCKVIMMQVLKSLREMHAEGFIHRDLKPQNIKMVYDEDDAAQVKVFDLGLGKSFEDNKWTTNQTEVLGDNPLTLRYAAPEQWLYKHKDYSHLSLGKHTDLYALGVTAYLCLTGRHPMDDDGIDADADLTDQYVPFILWAMNDKTVHSLPEGSYGGLSDIINKLLIKNIDPSIGPARYSDAQEVLDDLAALDLSAPMMSETTSYPNEILDSFVSMEDGTTQNIDSGLLSTIKWKVEDLPIDQAQTENISGEVLVQNAQEQRRTTKQKAVRVDPMEYERTTEVRKLSDGDDAPTTSIPQHREVPSTSPMPMPHAAAPSTSSAKWVVVILVLVGLGLVAFLGQKYLLKDKVSIQPVDAKMAKKMASKKSEKPEIKEDPKMLNEEAKLKANAGGVLIASEMKYKAKSVISSMKEKTSSRRKSKSAKKGDQSNKVVSKINKKPTVRPKRTNTKKDNIDEDVPIIELDRE